MSSGKKVSIVMCTYNGEKYIREQLDSIIAQTYPIYELVIQDDGSTDNTMSIVREYEAKYPFVKSLVNSVNLGFNKNFESACMRTTGDFVAISDQDDIWYPDKIEKQVAAIGDHDICFCCHHRGKSRENSILVKPQYALEALLFTSFAGHTMLLNGTFIRRKESWLDYIYYDWSLAIQAQLGKGIVRIDEPLNWHRSHDDSAGKKEHLKYTKLKGMPSTWQPYYYGYSKFRNLQKKKNWNRLYTMIWEKTASKSNQSLAHRMCRLMLNDDMFSLIRLCFICMKYRKNIYYNGNAKGFMGIIRGFFYPFIFAYDNTFYEL